MEGAYINATLGGAPTYASLHPLLRPAWWRGKYKSPLVRLRSALYGMLRAGFDWDDDWNTTVIIDIGFKKVKDCEVSLYYYQAENFDVVLLVLYVDDGCIVSKAWLVWYLVDLIKRKYKLTIQTGKFLTMVGMNFCASPICNGWLFVGIRMESYTKKLHDDYLREAGLESLRRFDTPEYAEGYDFGVQYEEDGVRKPLAKRFVGRLLYLVRCCRCDAYHGVIVIASETERWSVASDLKLDRIISFLFTTRTYGPIWSFDVSDGDDYTKNQNANQ